MPSPNPQTFTVIEQRGIVTTLVKLNIRKQPATNGLVIAVMAPQKGIEFSALIPDGEMISNNSVWYRDTNGNYFWSGGVAVSTPVLPDSKSGKAKINFSGIDFSGIELPSRNITVVIVQTGYNFISKINSQTLLKIHHSKKSYYMPSHARKLLFTGKNG